MISLLRPRFVHQKNQPLPLILLTRLVSYIYRTISGVNPRCGVTFVDDCHILTVGGTLFCITNCIQGGTKDQTFLPWNAENVTSAVVCQSAKLLALAERPKGGAAAAPNASASISIYDLKTIKRRKTITSTDKNAKEFLGLAFSSNGKLVAALTLQQQVTLHIWDVEGTARWTIPLKITFNPTLNPPQCSFNPITSGSRYQLVVIGHGTCALFTLDTSVAAHDLKPVQPNLGHKRDQQEFSCHAWISSTAYSSTAPTLMVGCGGEGGSEKGEVLVIRGDHLRQSIKMEDGGNPVSIATTANVCSLYFLHL